MTETEEAVTIRRRASPGYPTLDLRTAVERTLDLYKASPKHPVPLPVAAELWGFSPKSSSSKVTAAALKRFGFVRDVGGGGGRQLALTDEGREVAFYSDDRENERWTELMQDAAVEPKIHRQVIDHFGVPLPDERVVLRYLLFDLGFQDEPGARDFLKRLKSTLRFAGVDSIDPEGAASQAVSAAAGATPLEPQLRVAASPDQPDLRVAAPSPEREVADLRPAAPANSVQPPATADSVQPAATARQLGDDWRAPTAGPAESHPHVPPPERTVHDHSRAVKTVQIPYSNGRWAVLEAAFPLQEAEWSTMIAMLEAMKSGLVAPGEARGSAAANGFAAPESADDEDGRKADREPGSSTPGVIT